jgi:hypothetical protein
MPRQKAHHRHVRGLSRRELLRAGHDDQGKYEGMTMGPFAIGWEPDSAL